MKYDPKSSLSRSELQSQLIFMLKGAGFEEEFSEGVKERIFSRSVNPDVRVMVYTSISAKGIRGRGKDAIRVCAVRKFSDGKERGIVKNKRVNRTGEISNIVQRVLDRMRSSWKEVKKTEGRRCSKCGAHTFLSKKGNEVCGDLCWTRR